MKVILDDKHSFIGLVRNSANDLCVAIETPTQTVRHEVENLRTSISKPGTFPAFADAAKIGLADADNFLNDVKQGRRSLSEIPYDTEILGPQRKLFTSGEWGWPGNVCYAPA